MDHYDRQAEICFENIKPRLDKSTKEASPGNEDKHYNGDSQPWPVAVARGDGIAIAKFHIDKYLFRAPKQHPTKTAKETRLEDLNKAKWYIEQLILIEELGEEEYLTTYWEIKGE